MATENYIVRIYRRDEKNADEVSGIVEDIGARGKRVFQNYDELLAILKSPDKRPDDQTRGHGQGP